MRSFFLFLSVLYAFTLAYNTAYSAIKAGVEFRCSFRRPGTILYTRQQMYVTELFGDFTNVAVVTPTGRATVSFDEIFLAGSHFSDVQIFERGAQVGILELPFTHSSLVNDVYVNWTIDGYYSIRPILTFFRANQTTYNTMVVEEYNNTFGNVAYHNYLDVTFTTQSTNCQMTNMFYALVFSIYAFLVLIMIVIACLTLIESYKRNIFLRWVKKALWWVSSSNWYSQIDFCNEMTGEPTYYKDGDPYISLEKERLVTGADHGSSFLSGSGVDSFNVKGKYVSIGENGVQYLDTNKGVHPEVYTMEEPQKNDLRIYLREIMGDPKLVCVDETLTHHYKVVDVIKKLSEREGIRLCKRVTKRHFIALDMTHEDP
ncbi:unnamed protein product [Sphagnum jensenii]|uniref:Uncharacterized protein n=1 Tax=Sphagnum jensenii TaxID=128206 RepID=A0ABP1BC02_9BRYO